MITQYRPAYTTAPRAPSFSGRSIDTKPIDVENGARFKEIDTGRVYCFDKENKVWYEKAGGGGGSSVEIEPLTITENGTTTAPTGKAYNPVTVNVASGAVEPYMEESFDSNGNLIDAKMYGYTVVRESMFYNCASLKSVTIPDTVTNIKGTAFYDCRMLELNKLPDSLTYLGDYAFRNCWKLTAISLPNNLETIRVGCFYGCRNMVLTSLPNTLTTIGANSFQDCTNITISTIPASILTLGSNCFKNCAALRNITFEGKPTTVANNVFTDCSNLTTINVPWAEGEVANAPWGATNATINYNYTGG